MRHWSIPGRLVMMVAAMVLAAQTALAGAPLLIKARHYPKGGPFTIFHMNDAHARLLPHDFDVPEKNDVVEMEQVGGAACFAARLLALKAAEPRSLVLDAGDVSEGNPLGDLRGNGGMIDFYNLLDAKLKALGGRGIDAVVVGNHDVRSRQMLTNLKPASQGGRAQFPVISVNVCSKGTQTPVFAPYVTVTVNGSKVGILGYTDDESSYLGPDTENLIEVVPCTWEGGGGRISIKHWVETLRTKQNCAVVILLSHMGQRRVTSGDDALIADSGAVQPPEVVISGHWHTWTERVWQPANMHGKTLVAEAGSYLRYIGELKVSGQGAYIRACKHVIRDRQIRPDADVENLIAALTSEYNHQDPAPPYALNQVIGYSASDLILDKDKWWTANEYPWNGANSAGAWITDAMVWKAGRLGHPVDLALQSGGGIRRDIAKGAVTYVKIYEAYPWSDDRMVRVRMTGREIRDWIQSDHVGTAISAGWHVTAHDGQITAIARRGDPIVLSRRYNVAISAYMYAHPEIPLAGTTPENVGCSIRQAAVDYTAQYSTPQNPMYPHGLAARYDIDTEFAGGFNAVVTMIADNERQPYFEEAFVRLVAALPETLARRHGYGLARLVNPDGSINLAQRFSEIMLYRSHLGFPRGRLRPGDIIEVWGEGSFYAGTPEFVDQEGIYGPNQAFAFHGHDANLARPEYESTIAAFWDEQHENHYVKFYARKTGPSMVRDAAGMTIGVYQPGGYRAMKLPGKTGDILELTGVNTQQGAGRRHFRCHTALVAAAVPVSGYPPSSAVDPIDPRERPNCSITLRATASDVTGPGAGTAPAAAGSAQPTQVAFFYRHAPNGLAWGPWTSIGTDTNADDGWSLAFACPDGQGSYEFYSVARDADGNVEDAPVRADARVLVGHPPAAPAEPAIVHKSTGINLHPRLNRSR
jgi:2',3'-cyclic-nucleotide 2'-phosphodiesterase (5'-nucleotidase family)